MHVFEFNLIRFKSWDQFINSQTDDELICLNQSKEWKRWNRWWERWENRLLASEKKWKEWKRVCEGKTGEETPGHVTGNEKAGTAVRWSVWGVCVWQPETDQVWGEEDGVTSDLMERAQNQRHWSELEEEIYTSEESRCEFKQQINTFRLTHTHTHTGRGTHTLTH